MGTVIITALVSVLGTLVVGYFIWSAIGVRKLKKQVKNNNESITSINNTLDEYYKLIHELNNEQTTIIDNSFLNLQNRMEEENKSVMEILESKTGRIWSQFKLLDQNMETNSNDLHRELDKRFDKVYQAISETKK